MRSHWHRMHDRWRIRAALQPLKGIYIQKLYVRDLSYPTTTRINKFKGAARQKIFLRAVSLTPHAGFLRLKLDHISANSEQNSKRLWPVNQGPRRYCLLKKNQRSKISWHYLFNQEALLFWASLLLVNNNVTLKTFWFWI
jgi:hypothetical protein